MKYSLFLDDQRTPDQVSWIKLPNTDWTIVRNYDEFVNEILTNGLPEFISFDHDLSLSDAKVYCKNLRENKKIINYSDYKEKTGYDCAKWLVSYCQNNRLAVPLYAVHSMNPIGKENIEFYIENYTKSTLK